VSARVYNRHPEVPIEPDIWTPQRWLSITWHRKSPDDSRAGTFTVRYRVQNHRYSAAGSVVEEYWGLNYEQAWDRIEEMQVRLGVPTRDVLRY
jgi:hypothetical protein